MASDESGRRLAIGGPPTLRLVDTSTGRVIRRLNLPAPSAQVTDLSFQPGGDLVAVSTSDAGLYVLDTATGATVLRRPTPAGEAGRFSPDGTKLVVRDGAGTVTVVDPMTGTVLLPPVIQGRQLRNVWFTPDADAVVADAQDALITIRLDRREPLASAPFGEPGDEPGAVRSDGRVVFGSRHAAADPETSMRATRLSAHARGCRTRSEDRARHRARVRTAREPAPSRDPRRLGDGG